MTTDDRTEAYPVELHLPAGRARLVPGMAVYLLDGVPVDVDVEVPEDLAENWFWWGSQLYRRTPPGECGISIATGTFPPPGIAAPRGTCFDAAREIEATRARFEAARLAEALKKPAKKPKARRVAKPVPEIFEQAVMEL